MTRITIELDDRLYRTLCKRVGAEHISAYLSTLAAQQAEPESLTPSATLAQWHANNILDDADTPFDNVRERHDSVPIDWTNPC